MSWRLLGLFALLILAGCSMIGLATADAVSHVQSGLSELQTRIASHDGNLFSLTKADWGAIAGSVVTGVAGLNVYRNGTRKRALSATSKKS